MEKVAYYRLLKGSKGGLECGEGNSLLLAFNLLKMRCGASENKFNIAKMQVTNFKLQIIHLL